MTSADFSIILPEVILSVFAMAALLFGVYTGKDKTAPMLLWATAGRVRRARALDRLNGAGHQRRLRRHVRR